MSILYLIGTVSYIGGVFYVRYKLSDGNTQFEGFPSFGLAQDRYEEINTELNAK